MEKQSSVEWLVQELNHNIEFIPNVHHWDKIRNIIQQAKAMHKEEVMKSNRDGVDMVIDKKPYVTGEEYYNETFEK